MLAGVRRAFYGLAYARLRSQAFITVVGEAWLRGGRAWFGEGEMAQAVRLERPVFTPCRGGEGVGWLDNNAKDGREVQVWFGRVQLSGSGGAFGSCSSQGLPVRSRKASHWCRVRMRRGEAQKD